MIFKNCILLLICSLNHNVEIELRSGCKIGQNFYRKIYIFLSIFYFVQRGVTNACVVCKNSISEFLNSKITFTPLSTPSILFSLSLTPPVDQIILDIYPFNFLTFPLPTTSQNYMILNYISHAATSHHPCTISGQYAWDVMFIWGGVIKRVN